MISMCNSNAYSKANNDTEARVITRGIKYHAISHIKSSASKWVGVIAHDLNLTENQNVNINVCKKLIPWTEASQE